MLVAVCSDKGSPGATTTALALASAWLSSAILVEADPYGGDLAIRLRTQAGDALPETPTVLTVATAARTSDDADLVGRYAQQLNQQLSVVPGYLAAEQLGGVPTWEPLAAAASASPRPVVIDLGRLHAGSPVLPLAVAADVVVVVGRADVGSVIRLRERLCRLIPALASRRGAPPSLWPVLVTAARHGAGDVADLRRVLADTAAAPLLSGVGYVGFDSATVSRLEAGESPAGRLARTTLLRTARVLVTEIVAAVEDQAPVGERV